MVRLVSQEAQALSTEEKCRFWCRPIIAILNEIFNRFAGSWEQCAHGRTWPYYEDEMQQIRSRIDLIKSRAFTILRKLTESHSTQSLLLKGRNRIATAGAIFWLSYWMDIQYDPDRRIHCARFGFPIYGGGVVWVGPWCDRSDESDCPCRCRWSDLQDFLQISVKTLKKHRIIIQEIIQSIKEGKLP